MAIDKFPKDFLIPHRKENDECPVCTSKVKRFSISGRHGYFCLKCQSKNQGNLMEKGMQRIIE